MSSSSSLITICGILTFALHCKSQTNVCTQPIAITNSDICPQAIALGSVNYTCSLLAFSLNWSSTIWSEEIDVFTSIESPPSDVAGVTISITVSAGFIGPVPSCIRSTLTFTGNLTALNGETLTCRHGELSTTRTIAIPGVAPGLTTELQQTSPIANNSSSETPCDLYDITVKWTPPTNTGGQGVLIDYYLVSVSGPDGYTCPADQCNVTTTNTTLTGIVCNTSHIVSVRAVNCAGSSNDSESMEIFIIELPSEPTPTIATTPSPISQCPELKPVINSSVDGCQVLLQDSLSYTCSFDGDSIQWFSSIWLDSIFVNIGATGPLPPLLVTGITMSASTFNVAGCLNSTLTFTGNLAALNGTQLFCRFGELFDNYTIVIPGAPGPPTSLFSTPSSLGSELIACGSITLQWTRPTVTGGQGVAIEYYLVSLSGPDEYTCPQDQCNTTTTNTTLTGLQCNTTYTARVRAVNCAGVSIESAPVELLTSQPPNGCTASEVPNIIATTNSVDVCQPLSQSSLSATCVNSNPFLKWNSTLWTDDQLLVSGDVELLVSGDAETPPQVISEGVMLTERHFVNASSNCFTSIVTITGNLSALNNVTVDCEDSDEVNDRFIGVIQRLTIPGSSTLTNIALSTICDGDGSQATVQWTPPTNTASEQITHYEVIVESEGDCIASEQLLCNQDVVTASAATNTTITALQCDTVFMVSVRAVNCAGQKGTPSQTLMFHTALAIGIPKEAGLLWWHTTLIVLGVLFLIVIMFMIVFIGCRNEQSKTF